MRRTSWKSIESIIRDTTVPVSLDELGRTCRTNHKIVGAEKYLNHYHMGKAYWEISFGVSCGIWEHGECH